jgi:EPS-associated MarR family transcriptional regulator
MPENDLDYELLRQIVERPTASQRGLAVRLGVSVGKVNYCLRALVDKGWVKANNFRSSDNKLAYAYLLTPRGARQSAADLRVSGTQGTRVRTPGTGDCRVAQ